jgi:hypothetical protein
LFFVDRVEVQPHVLWQSRLLLKLTGRRLTNLPHELRDL